MDTIAKGARCYGATGVLAVVYVKEAKGDRGGISKIIPPGPAPTGVAVRSTAAASASIAGTVVTVNVPQPAGHARYGKHE